MLHTKYKTKKSQSLPVDPMTTQSERTHIFFIIYIILLLHVYRKVYFSSILMELIKTEARCMSRNLIWVLKGKKFYIQSEMRIVSDILSLAADFLWPGITLEHTFMI